MQCLERCRLWLAALAIATPVMPVHAVTTQRQQAAKDQTATAVSIDTIEVAAVHVGGERERRSLDGRPDELSGRTNVLRL